MTSSATFRKRRSDLEAFLGALGRFLSVMEAQHNGLLYDSGATWAPRPGQEMEAARLKVDVDRLAGRAAYAFAAAGSFVDWKPRGTFQRQPVNPAVAWATILDWDPMFDSGTIFACGAQALGLLEMKAEEAEEYERHKVRRAFRWIGRLTGSGLRPLGRWSVRTVEAGIVAAAGAAVTLWLS
jgi:hypothetical protein